MSSLDPRRDQFFKMVDTIPVDPLVSWAREEIVRLENALEKALRVAPVVITGPQTAGGTTEPKG